MQDSFYKLPTDLAQDIEGYAAEVARFESGDLAPGLLRAKRVPRGVYEQRDDGSYMVRVRIAGGAINSAQAETLATQSKIHGAGRLHVTTRQDIQIHDVKIGDTPDIMRALMADGLTSKGGGGNTVRNVMACPYAGICPFENFDVTPFAHSVTEFLIPLVGSYNLPRKYKIAFSGCGADCALARVNDLGFIAKSKNNELGFKVYAGGGMGVHSRAGDLMEEWVPARDVVRVAEAVRRIFDQLGNREDRQRARLRFVFEKIGAAAVRDKLHEEMQKTKDEGIADCDVAVPINDTEESTKASSRGPVLSNLGGVRFLPQRQEGFVTIPIHLPLGFVESDELRKIAEVAKEFSAEQGFRTTRSQNLVLRFVKKNDIASLAAALAQLPTDVLKPAFIERFAVCAGASTCRLGLCLSRRAARACADALMESTVDIGTLAGVSIKISGCPNACGQHPVADIGFFGIAQRHKGRLLPCYRVVIGARNDRDNARLAASTGQVPARSLPDLLVALATDFQENRSPGEVFADYFERRGVSHFEAVVKQFGRIPPHADSPEFYRDWGQDEEFSLAGRGAGECGAGVFEVIRGDIAEAHEASDLFRVLLPACRALLITRGVDAQNPEDILRAFEKHFLETGLVDTAFRGLLSRARVNSSDIADALKDSEDEIQRLLARVELLFSTLDSGLEFHPPEGAARSHAHTEIDSSAQLDLSGVKCPMNFVKAKLRLEGMAIGDTLAIILDAGEPIQNVPPSFHTEGQEIVEVVDLGDGHWRLVIRKIR